MRKSIEESVIYQKISEDLLERDVAESLEILRDQIIRLRKSGEIVMQTPFNTRRGIKGKALNLIKKLMDKCAKRYLSPILEQQGEFNEAAVRIFDDLIIVLEKQQKNIELSSQNDSDEELL